MGERKRLETDAASLMFALGRHNGREYLIRFAVSLREDIEPDILQVALSESILAYSYFFIRFTEDGNRLYAEPVRSMPEVHEKPYSACSTLPPLDDGCEAEVSYTGNTIFFEFFHGVSDGMGGFSFLLYLLGEYLSLKYHDKSILASVPVISPQEQILNGYKNYAKGISVSGNHGSAYHIRGSRGPTAITDYHLSVPEVRNKANKLGVSITEYLSAILTSAIIMEQKKKGRSRRIRLTVPVNLRTRFPYLTTRNFTLNVYPEISPGKDFTDIPSISAKYHSYMRVALQKDLLAGRCAISNKIADSPLMRMLPLSFKRWCVRSALNSSGGTITFSNMGEMKIPDKLKQEIIDLGMVFSAKPESPYSCSVISLNGRMKISFLKTIKEQYLEEEFEKILTKEKIRYERGAI